MSLGSGAGITKKHEQLTGKGILDSGLRAWGLHMIRLQPKALLPGKTAHPVGAGAAAILRLRAR